MKKKIIIIIIAILALVAIGAFVAAFVLTEEKEEVDPLIGAWDYNNMVYVFKEDKTGSYKSGETEMKFTYEVEENKISIMFNGNTEANVLEYKIEDNKLITKDENKNTVTYYRTEK